MCVCGVLAKVAAEGHCVCVCVCGVLTKVAAEGHCVVLYHACLAALLPHENRSTHTTNRQAGRQAN